jgi:hypothetical protein
MGKEKDDDDQSLPLKNRPCRLYGHFYPDRLPQCHNAD